MPSPDDVSQAVAEAQASTPARRADAFRTILDRIAADLEEPAR